MLVDVIQAAHYRFGPLLGGFAQDVFGVIFIEHHVEVFRVVVIISVFIIAQGIQKALPELAAQLTVVGYVFVKVGSHITNDQALEVLLVFQRIFHAQDPTPGIAQQIEIVFIQAELLPYLFDLFHKTGDGPEAVIVGLIGIMRTQLIVMIKLDIGLREKGIETFEVFMRQRRTAMQQQDLHRAIAKALGPDFITFLQFDHLHPHPSG